MVKLSFKNTILIFNVLFPDNIIILLLALLGCYFSYILHLCVYGNHSIYLNLTFSQAGKDNCTEKLYSWVGFKPTAL